MNRILATCLNFSLVPKEQVYILQYCIFFNAAIIFSIELVFNILQEKRVHAPLLTR